MPFTGSHPAAVLPLIRLGLVPSALVIGSMVPDLPYYLPISIPSEMTHSATGIVGIDLLLGLLSFAVWHQLVAPLAVAVAPSALRARLASTDPARPARPGWPSARYLALLVLSLVAGAATHVAWDEFTHIDRFGYRHLSWLAQVHGPLAGYRWAQYGSGVVGALLIAVAVRNWWRSAAVVDPQPRSRISPSARVAVLASVSLATLGGALAGGASAALGDEGVRRALFLIATWGGGAGLVTLLACAVFLRTTVTAVTAVTAEP